MASKPFKELFAIPLRNGLTKPKAVRGDGTKMVNMGELFSNPRMINVTMDRVPLNQAERDLSLLAAGDLLFARQSLVLSGAGKCSIFVSDAEEVCFESHVIRCRLNRNLADPDFYFYFFGSFAGRKLIESIVEQGAGASGIRGSDLAALEVPWVDLAAQMRAAAVLRSLDDKINLNCRINQTLESIAQALFKSWFVDFDGVAKKDMQESELGLIPKGWRVEEIGNLVQCVGGATPSTKNESFWNHGKHPWATPKDLSKLQAPILISTERSITDAGLARISSGLLPAGTLLMSSRAPIGYLAIATMSVAINQGLIAMLPEGSLSPIWLLFWAKNNMETIKQRANGSTFMEISKTSFRSIKIAVPAADKLAQFDAMAKSLLARIISNERDIAILAALRDTLLPKLLSGELTATNTGSIEE